MSKVIKIFAADPGLTSFGYSFLEYNLTTGNININRFGTITGKSLLKQQKDLQNKFEKRYIILWELEKVLQEMFIELKPDFIISESAFSHTFIQSFAALTMVIQSIRTAAKNTIGKDIYLIAPRESKKAVSQDGTSNKKSVQDAIFKNPNIIIKNSKTTSLETLTEHAYDSIAAGIAFINNHLPSILSV